MRQLQPYYRLVALTWSCKQWQTTDIVAQAASTRSTHASALQGRPHFLDYLSTYFVAMILPEEKFMLEEKLMLGMADAGDSSIFGSTVCGHALEHVSPCAQKQGLPCWTSCEDSLVPSKKANVLPSAWEAITSWKEGPSSLDVFQKEASQC